VFTCALAPAYTIRWHIGFYPTTLLENLLLLTVATFAVETWRGHHRVRWRNAFTIPALLFLLAGAISVVDAPDRRAALGLYRAYIVEPIAFAIVVATVCGNARRAYLVLGGLLLGAVWVGVPNGVVVLAAIRDHSYHVTDTPPVIFYQTQNAVALFMEPLIAAAAAVLLYVRDPRIRLFSLLALCVLLPVEVLTFSRGGYLAVAVVAVALAVSHRRRLWLSLGLVAAGLLFSRLPLVANRIVLETHNVYGNTVFFRFEIWSATVKLLRQRPLAGAGLSGFQERIAPFWNAIHPLPSQRFNDPHNIVLNFWVETGLLGLLAFTWIFLALLAAGWRGWRKGDRDWRPLSLGVILALVAIVVHGLVDVPYFKNDLSLEFWVLLALGYAATLNLPAPSGTGAQAFFLRRRDQSPNRLSRSLPLDSRACS
jgi:O-antigen ligase